MQSCSVLILGYNYFTNIRQANNNEKGETGEYTHITRGGQTLTPTLTPLEKPRPRVPEGPAVKRCLCDVHSRLRVVHRGKLGRPGEGQAWSEDPERRRAGTQGWGSGAAPAPLLPLDSPPSVGSRLPQLSRLFCCFYPVLWLALRAS